MKLEDFDDILNFKQMLDILKIGRTKGYKLLQTGAIKSKRIGRVYRIPKSNVITYLESK